MEGPQPSERGATVGGPEGQVSAPVCDGLGVDGKREYQSVREGASGRKSV